jgi:hypothetical protein
MAGDRIATVVSSRPVNRLVDRDRHYGWISQRAGPAPARDRTSPARGRGQPPQARGSTR